MTNISQQIMDFFVSFEGKVAIALTSLLVILISFIFSFLKSKVKKTDLDEEQVFISSENNNEICREVEENKEDEILEITLAEGLQNTRRSLWGKIKSLIKDSGKNQHDFFLAFEELLIESDLGVKTSTRLIDDIRAQIGKSSDSLDLGKTIENLLKTKIVKILDSNIEPEIEPNKVSGLPKVILVVGVNGAGKTTTIGKLAFQFRARGAKVMLAACDTFRAAATGQLEVWAERSNSLIEKGKDGEKPSTVAYRAIHRAKEESVDVLLIDTAGRLHTKVNLMNELSSVTSIVSRECEGAPHETILVLDGSTGQNALQQAREFNAATKLSGIVITKLDGTQKGGIVIAIKDELNIPVRYLGIGEGVGDLRPFDSAEFTEALLGNFDLASDDVLIDFSSSSSDSSKVVVNASSLE